MLVPLHDNVIVEPMDDHAHERASGVLLQSAHFKGDQRGRVVAVGPGLRGRNGERTPIKYRPGDVVVCMKHSRVVVKNDGKDYYMVRTDQILAKIERE